MIQNIAVSVEQNTSVSTEQSIFVLQSTAQANDSQHLQGGKKESNRFSKVLTMDRSWGWCDLKGEEEQERTAVLFICDFHNYVCRIRWEGGRETGKTSIYQLPLSVCCMLRNISAIFFAKRAELLKLKVGGLYWDRTWASPATALVVPDPPALPEPSHYLTSFAFITLSKTITAFSCKMFSAEKLWPFWAYI